MKHLNQKSAKILKALFDSMNDPRYVKTPGSYAKLDNGGPCIMPVSVEKLCHIPTFDEHFVVSHTYEQNGDLMRDPEMEFVLKDDKYYPITYRQDNLGIMQEVLEYRDSDGTPVRYKPKLQRDLVEFANMWMQNINEQQHLGVAA
jgi:hypothetical protein